MGRKSLKDEVVSARAINNSWAWVDKALRSKKLTFEEKGKIAMQIAQKSVPKKLKVEGDVTQSLAEIMKAIYTSKKGK